MREIKKILKGCLAGNKGDQELLYRRYSAKLYAVCLQYTSSREDARDVLQESFIKIFTNLSSYSWEGSFEGWMRRIAVNSALEKHRNRYYLNKVDDFDSVPETALNSDNKDFSGMEADDLLGFIKELSPKYRMVFNLYALEGYSHREIAGMLNISEGTSKSNLSRARNNLQKKVEVHLGIKKRMING